MRKRVGLRRDARQPRGLDRALARDPFDEVDDTQRKRIRVPADTASRRIFTDPTFYEAAQFGFALMRARRVEIVQVVEVVEPKMATCWVVPVRGLVYAAVLAEEFESPGRDQVRLEQRLQWPGLCPLPPLRNPRLNDAWRRQPIADPVQDLATSQEPDHVEQPRRLAQRHKGSVRCAVARASRALGSRRPDRSPQRTRTARHNATRRWTRTK